MAYRRRSCTKYVHLNDSLIATRLHGAVINTDGFISICILQACFRVHTYSLPTSCTVFLYSLYKAATRFGLIISCNLHGVTGLVYVYSIYGNLS